MIALKEKIADRNILKLIKSFLKTPIKEGKRITGGKRNKMGTPQGGVISPLLANVYFHLLDRIINNPRSLFGKAHIKMVRYADDFVLMGKWLNPKIMEHLEELLERMELAINWDKSRVIQAKEDSFDFLGYTFRYDRPIIKNGKNYWNIQPSKKSIMKLRLNISEYLAVRRHLPTPVLIKGLNPKLRGWLNYFKIPKVSYIKGSCFQIGDYLEMKMHRHFQRKSQRPCKRYSQYPYTQLIKEGLIDVRTFAYG